MKNNYACINLIVLFLFVVTVQGQTLTFTIDTAVDNGTAITETLVDNGDTYVLTVIHPSNEELDNLGGGDLIFFLGSTSLEPHVLSITKNGSMTNFTLNGLDYDTLGAGTISLQNQDNAIISSPTSYGLGAGEITITNPANAIGITSFTIIPADSDDLNDFGFHNIEVDILDTLSNDLVIAPNEKLTIHPNPIADNFFIELSDITSTGQTDIEIYNVTGQNVLSIKDYKTNTPINSSDFQLGIYFAKICSNDKIVVRKLIKK